MSERKSLSRRQFLRRVVVGVGAVGTPALITACGGQTAAPTTAPDAATAAAPAATAAQAPAATAAGAAQATAPATTGASVELTWWDRYVTQEPWILEEINLFMEANPGITVTRIKQPKMEDAIKAAFQDGSLPDLWLETENFRDLAVEGYLTPISDFPDYEEFVQTFPNPAIDFAPGQNIFDGKTYGAPFDARGAMWNFLFMNTKVFKDAGIVDDKGEAKVPQTLDEMIAAMRTITEQSGGSVYGYASPIGDGFGAMMQWWWGARSGAPFDGVDPKTGKSIYATNPAYKSLLEFVVLGRDEGWTHPMSASANDEAIRALFAEGEAGIIPNGAWAINGWEQTHPDFKDYRPIAPPLINTDKQLGWYLASPGGSFVRLSSQTKHPEEAWKLFKWFQSKDAARRYVESGNGASIWLELNDPAYMKPIAYEAYKINADNTRVGPYQPNPDMEKVNFTDIKPSEQAVLQGVFAGQITDIDAALQELATARDKMKEQAFADAKAAGAEKVGFEYLALQTQFPDWDPTAGKDYEPQE